jgi:putative ABC transport system permease protein
MSWWSRLSNVFRPDRVDDDLSDELRFHLEERTRELMASGMAAHEAAAAAARRLGNPVRWREQSRDVKLLPWLDSIVRDSRLGMRMLRKNAVVTAAAVLSLGLALGACVAAFSMVDALILRPLPVRDPARLVYLLFPTYTPERPEADTFNDPTFVRLRDASRNQVHLFAMSTQVIRSAVFDADGTKEKTRTQYVSGDTFDVLGVGAALGRVLTPTDDNGIGTHPVAVVSHAFWTRRFGGDPSVVGRWFTLEGKPLQIVGVTTPRFSGAEPGRPSDVWIPYSMYNPRAFGNAEFNWFRILGRLEPNGRAEQAQSVLQAAFTSFRRERAELMGFGRSPESVARFVGTPLIVRSAANGPSPLRVQFERSLWILSAIAALVLFIAGSNVANLFLARTVARDREMALRVSIGAGRMRLIQQMLIESALVAAAACVLGFVFAAVSTPAVVNMLASPDDPVTLDLGADWRVLLVGVVLTLSTTALFGLLPALRASDISPTAALKNSATRASARAAFMRPFVAMQIAFGLVVLFVGSLLVLSFGKASSIDPGFSTSSVLLLSLDTTERVDAAQQRAALFAVLDRLRTISGVHAASAAEFNLIGRAWTYNVRVPGTAQETIEATMQPVAAGFFDTMNIRILAGRGFVGGDMDAGNAIVVSESFAARYFGRAPALGRTLQARFGEDDAEAGVHEIVGVVSDTKYDVRKPAAPAIYIPIRPRRTNTINVRVSGDPAAFVAVLREQVRAASPLFRVSAFTTQSAVVDQTLLRERLLALLAGFFALVGVVLAGVGLYGVLSYSVVQRTREIGVRVALGAVPRRVIGTILSDVTLAVLFGMALGLAGGVYLSRFVESLLFETRPLSVATLALPLATLVIAAALAALVPAVRAARVDPVIALRCE